MTDEEEGGLEKLMNAKEIEKHLSAQWNSDRDNLLWKTVYPVSIAAAGAGAFALIGWPALIPFGLAALGVHSYASKDDIKDGIKPTERYSVRGFSLFHPSTWRTSKKTDAKDRIVKEKNFKDQYIDGAIRIGCGIVAGLALDQFLPTGDGMSFNIPFTETGMYHLFASDNGFSWAHLTAPLFFGYDYLIRGFHGIKEYFGQAGATGVFNPLFWYNIATKSTKDERTNLLWGAGAAAYGGLQAASASGGWLGIPKHLAENGVYSEMTPYAAAALLIGSVLPDTSKVPIWDKVPLANFISGMRGSGRSAARMFAVYGLSQYLVGKMMSSYDKTTGDLEVFVNNRMEILNSPALQEWANNHQDTTEFLLNYSPAIGLAVGTGLAFWGLYRPLRRLKKLEGDMLAVHYPDGVPVPEEQPDTQIVRTNGPVQVRELENGMYEFHFGQTADRTRTALPEPDAIIDDDHLLGDVYDSFDDEDSDPFDDFPE